MLHLQPLPVIGGLVLIIIVGFSLDPRRKYHVRLLAYNNMEDGYQADQTVSTPGCVCKSEPPGPVSPEAEAVSPAPFHLRLIPVWRAQLLRFFVSFMLSGMVVLNV